MKLTLIKGIGKITEKKLNELGIENVRELLNYLPSAYIDMSLISDMKDVSDGGYYLFNATVRTLSSFKRGIKVNSFRATAYSGDVKLNLVWFNQPYMYDKISTGTEYTFFGKIFLKDDGISVNNPIFEIKGMESKLKGILPIYKTRGLVHQGNFRKFILSAIERDKIPSLMRGREDIEDVNDALKKAHMPASVQEGYAAQRRLLIEELVNMIVGYKIINSKSVKDKKRIYKDTSYDELIKSLPYDLTPSQINAVNEITADLIDKNPMNRLLMGDVGSGKTIVAFIAAYLAVKNGYQAAILAPTAILANQHYKNAELLKNLGLSVRLLTAEVIASERENILEELKSGQADIVIGTHSLLSDEIEFHNLALVVTDELHRFGVSQKNDFEQKGISIDTLVVSATPIPRALSLTLYNDLKVSEIARRADYKIKTHIVTSDRQEDMMKFIRNEIISGRQAYIVCPRIEDIEGIEIASVRNLYDSLRKGVLKDISIAFLHGKMKSEIKDRIMKDFLEGKIKALVSTTVIEVGIDVPNASVMVIMNAERYGLAALHQLRGRVGRGEYQSYCFLCSDGLKH